MVVVKFPWPCHGHVIISWGKNSIQKKCCEAFDDDDKVKGLDTLIDHAKLKYDTKVHERLVEKALLADTVIVHKTL